MKELAQLVDELGRLSFDARLGHRALPESFDEELWRNLEDTGLSRLTSSKDAGPAEVAIVLSGLARHAAAVPIARRLYVELELEQMPEHRAAKARPRPYG